MNDWCACIVTSKDFDEGIEEEVRTDSRIIQDKLNRIFEGSNEEGFIDSPRARIVSDFIDNKHTSKWDRSFMGVSSGVQPWIRRLILDSEQAHFEIIMPITLCIRSEYRSEVFRDADF